MRISELLENKRFEEADFIEKVGDKSQVNYDLIEDLIYFMNNDDDVYRRHLFPAIVKCINSAKFNKSVTPNVFQDAVIKSYDEYSRNFPIKELPLKLTKKTCDQICDQLYKSVFNDIKQGKYN